MHYYDSGKPLKLLALSFPLFAIFILVITIGRRRVKSMKIYHLCSVMEPQAEKQSFLSVKLLLSQDYLNVSRNKLKICLMRKHLHIILMSILICNADKKKLMSFCHKYE